MKRAVCLLLSAALLLGALSACRSPAAGPGAAGLAARELVRSEERRVGKECGS